MVLPNIITSVCLLSLGGIILGAGLLRLSLQDRQRMEYDRQSSCRWHHWQVLDDGTALVCGLCGKRSRRVNGPSDRGPGSISTEINPP